MKKVLALFLVMAMLIPAGLTMPAEAEEIKKQDFYALGWSDFDEETYPYLDGLVTSTMSNLGENAKHSYGSASMLYGSYTDEDVTKLAEAVKKEMDSRPAGMRYWTVFGPMRIMALAPKNALFMDHGVDQMAEMMEALLKKYKEIGGVMDGMVVDIEYVGLGCYYLVDAVTDKQTNNLTKNPNLLKQIVKDSRYKTEIRPLLEEYGFIFYQAENAAQQAERTELYSITKSAGAKYEKSRLVWDTVMRIHLNRYVDEWLYTPLQKYFPEASLSDYQSIDSATWLKMAAVTDDGITMSGGNSVKSGNTSSYSYYYSRPSADFYNQNQKYSGYNDAIFAAEPFSNLLYDINFTRHMYESSDTKLIAPWITGYTYGGQKPQSIAYTPYYSDLLYHLGMFDPEPFLSYTYTGDLNRPGEWELTSQIMNDVMKALSDVAGYADRKPIAMPQNWNSKFVLSGMYTGGRNLWRITPNTSILSRSEFLISESDPTFFINGETVTFPGGKILDEAEIPNCGSVGYWVETDKDVMPVVTAEENRYETYPSLKFDFENYELGAFDYNTAKPTNAWGFSWGKTADGIKGESNIITVDGNKKLSIIGNSRNWIKDLAGNITAGDTYAKEQAWQITVTIPEGLSKDAELMLLNYAGSKQEVSDGGFMVKGNKLYYAAGEEDADGELVYKEMMDVEGDTTYIFTRYMDFTNKDAFTCTYVVANKNGRELKRVEDVPAPVFNYITQLTFGVAGADKPIVIDDFKIFLTGTALDFGVYDAKTGQDAPLKTERDKSTAYRLSWLNATMEEETAFIKADITAGGKTTTTVIKEIKMLPGTDGIETGVVEIKEGQSVKVYLEDSLHPTAPADEPGPLVDATFTAGGIQNVPGALQEAGMDSLEKIRQALEAKLQEAGSAKVEGIAHYQVAVSKNDIPRHGKMTVIMPYPEGTDANYTFYAAQLYAADGYGKTAGDVEAMEVINTAEGIQFEIYGTSPIAIGWTAPQEVEATDATEAVTATRTPNELTRPIGTRITRPTEEVYIEETEATEYMEETEEPTEYTEETEETEYVEEPTQEPTEAPTQAPGQEEEAGVNVVLIVVIAAVVLAGAGVAAWFLVKKKKAAVVSEDTDDMEETEAAETSEEKTEE